MSLTDHLNAIVLHAYYVGELEAGRRACERLLSMELPHEAEMSIRRNRVWYQPLLSDFCSVTHHKIDIPPAREGWSLYNPTILWDEGRLLGLVRSSNYAVVDGNYVYPPEDEGNSRTEYQLVVFDERLQLLERKPVQKPDYPRSGFFIQDMEDHRLFLGSHGLRVSGTVRDAVAGNTGCRIAMADLDLASGRLEHFQLLPVLSDEEHEKNWMPILESPHVLRSRPGGEARWLYACHHQGSTATVEYGAGESAWRMIPQAPAPVLAKRFRGGGQVVPFTFEGQEGWLAIVHEVAYFGDRRNYEHRFVFLDHGFAVTAVTQPFALREPRTIEFAAGLATIGERVIVSFGVRDCEAWLSEMPAADVRRALTRIVITPSV